MKRFAILFLCSFYFLLASGLHLSMHYCGGKLESIGATESNEVGCCGNTMKKAKKKKCCQEKFLVFQIKNSHQQASQAHLPKISSTFMFSRVHTVSELTLVQSDIEHLFADALAPPSVSKPILYLNHRNFRI